MDAKSVAQCIYDCLERGDLKGVLDTVADDVVWEVVGPPIIPYGGRYVGQGGVRQFFISLFEYEEILEFTPERYIDGGSTVAVIGRKRCRSKYIGREYNARWVQIFTVKDDKLVSWSEHIDTAPIVEAYSVPPTGPF